MTQPSLSWIKQINFIAQSQEIPQWGKTIHIDWDKLSQQLSSIFSINGLEVRKIGSQWLSSDELLAGLGTKPQIHSIELYPIDGSCFLAVSSEDKKKLVSCFLAPNDKKKGLNDPRLEEGFYYYSLLETLKVIDSLHLFENCSLKMGEASFSIDDTAFCIDVAIHKGGETFYLRVISSQEFNNSFKAFYQQQRIKPEFNASFPLPLSCIIGSTTLNMADWRKIEVGDFVLLDSCTYDPSAHKGSVDIYTYGKKILQARLKPSGLKIVDFSEFLEGSNMIDDEKHFEDEEDFDMNDEAIEEELTEEEVDNTPNRAEEITENALSSLSKLPLNIQVEVAKFSMPLEKILQLSSGNIIETGVHPEQGVSLVINGKKIAKGELVKIGDMLGVKILEMGEP